MARSIGMTLQNPTPVYRAVILRLFPGVHNRELKRYTTADGTEYLYHDAEAYGPYGTRAPATAQVTTALRHHNNWIKQGHYTTRRVWNPVTRTSETENYGTVPSFAAFIEEQIPSWQQVPGTIKEA